MPIEDPITGRTWLDHHEAAAYLGKTDRWLRNQLAVGAITVHKRGGTNVFLLSDLEEYENARIELATPRPTTPPAQVKRRRHAT